MRPAAYHAMLSLGVHHRQRPTIGIDGQVWKLRPLRVVPDVYALAAERPRRVGDVRDDATRAGVGDEVVRLGGPRGGAPVESAPLAAAFLRLRLAFVPSHPRGRVLCRVPCSSSRETELVLSEDIRKCSSSTATSGRAAPVDERRWRRPPSQERNTCCGGYGFRPRRHPGVESRVRRPLAVGAGVRDFDAFRQP